MPELTLSAAQTIVAEALAYARRENLKPLAVAVLDARGTLNAIRQDRIDLFASDH